MLNNVRVSVCVLPKAWKSLALAIFWVSLNTPRLCLMVVDTEDILQRQ